MRQAPERARPRPVITALELDEYDRWYFGRIKDIDVELARRVSRSPEAEGRALDVFAALYKANPTLRDGLTSDLAAFGRTLLEHPDLVRLRKRTLLDEVAALSALRFILKSLAESARSTRGRRGRSLVDAARALVKRALAQGEVKRSALDETARHASETLSATREGLDPAHVTVPAMDKALHDLFSAYEEALAELETFDMKNGLTGRRGPASYTAPQALTFKHRRTNREPPRTFDGLEGPPKDAREKLVANVLHLRKTFEGAHEGLARERVSGFSAAANEALIDALRHVEEPQKIVDDVLSLFEKAFGWGRQQGAGHRVPFAELSRLAEFLQCHSDVRRIADLAGRWLAAVNDAPIRKKTKVPEEVVGVLRGGSLKDVLAAELIGLKHPVLRRLTIAKLVERTLLCRALEGRDRLSKGPIICVVDTSGSMSGPREHFAKALALALALRAFKGRRPFYLMTFGAAREIVEVAMPRAMDPWTRLKEVLEFGFGGGTDFDGPLRRVAELATEKEWSQADAVFISDGDCVVGAGARATLEGARGSTDIRLIEVNVGGGDGLDGVSDERFDVVPGRLGEPSATVAEALGGRM